MRAPFRPSTSDFSSLMHAGYLRVSGPLHLRMVIQVLLSPCMVEMRAYTDCTPSFTSLAEDDGGVRTWDLNLHRLTRYPLRYIPAEFEVIE